MPFCADEIESLLRRPVIMWLTEIIVLYLNLLLFSLEFKWFCKVQRLLGRSNIGTGHHKRYVNSKKFILSHITRFPLLMLNNNYRITVKIILYTFKNSDN